MYDAALAHIVMDTATTRMSINDVIRFFMVLTLSLFEALRDRVGRILTCSKAAFAALVLADAFFQHGKEVFIGQAHR